MTNECYLEIGVEVRILDLHGDTELKLNVVAATGHVTRCETDAYYPV